jgi:hypothetical protein
MKKCSICDEKHSAKGLCRHHYYKKYNDEKRGDKTYVRSMDLKSRLSYYSKLDESTGCLIWQGFVDSGGYGHTTINGKTMRAHVASYIANYGEIASGLFVCHKCDVRNCINPQHLFLGTSKDNSLDMSSKNRSCYGSKTKFSKITEKQAAEIFLDKRPQKLIALIYGISKSAVQSIKYGRSWVRVTKALRA